MFLIAFQHIFLFNDKVMSNRRPRYKDVSRTYPTLPTNRCTIITVHKHLLLSQSDDI